MRTPLLVLNGIAYFKGIVAKSHPDEEDDPHLAKHPPRTKDWKR